MKYMLWRSTIMELNSPSFMILSMSVSWLVKIFNMYQYNSSASALIELDVTVLAAMCCLVDFNYSSKVINPVDFRSIESNTVLPCCILSFSLVQFKVCRSIFINSWQSFCSIKQLEEGGLTDESIFVGVCINEQLQERRVHLSIKLTLLGSCWSHHLN